MFTYDYHFLLVVINVYSCFPMFTYFYQCLPLFTCVYLCLLEFTYVCNCSLVFTYVNYCTVVLVSLLLLKCNNVYLCLHLFTNFYPYSFVITYVFGIYEFCVIITTIIIQKILKMKKGRDGEKGKKQDGMPM